MDNEIEDEEDKNSKNMQQIRDYKTPRRIIYIKTTISEDDKSEESEPK